MKLDKFALICAVTLGAALSAEVKKEEPRPLATELTADEKAAYGSLVSTLLNLRLRREQLERKATEEVPGLSESRKDVATQEKEFQQKLAELQKKHNAPGCVISLDYKWLDAAGEPCLKPVTNAAAKK
jgi:hypothetical protein